jgi:hypothetical protein
MSPSSNRDKPKAIITQKEKQCLPRSGFLQNFLRWQLFRPI